VENAQTVLTTFVWRWFLCRVQSFCNFFGLTLKICAYICSFCLVTLVSVRQSAFLTLLWLMGAFWDWSHSITTMCLKYKLDYLNKLFYNTVMIGIPDQYGCPMLHLCPVVSWFDIWTAFENWTNLSNFRMVPK
jgi:hypothetical protein